MLQQEQLIQNRYQIVGILGQGGMAMVYLATDTRLGIQVALKELNPNQLPPAEQASAIALFQQEAQVLAQLKHPTIARCTDSFTENGLWYLVSEYVPGETLEHALGRFHRFQEQQVLHWANELVNALDYLHHLNPPIIFRDLKPSNMMVRSDGKLKLIDFGIARFFKAGQYKDTIQLGTPGYAPPEQYGRGQTDARSDVYSLGVVLYQLLTGYDPTQSPMNLPAVTQLAPDISPTTAAAIHKAIQPNPPHRHQSIAEFAAALSLPISGHLPASTPPSLSLSEARWWLALKIGGLVLLLLLIGVGFILSRLVAQRDATLPTATPRIAYVVVTSSPTPSPLPPTETPSPAASPPSPNTPTPIPTLTIPPSPTPRPSTPTPIPSPTRLPASPTPLATVCALPVNSLFTSKWQANLGCPTTNLRDISMAQETFVKGRMFWRQDNDRIYAVYNNGTWASYADIWAESNPTFSCGTQQTPPTPQRGFGKIWCANSAVQQGLGNATDLEWATYGEIQEFVNGMIWRVGGNTTIVFYYNSSWR